MGKAILLGGLFAVLGLFLTFYIPYILHGAPCLPCPPSMPFEKNPCPGDCPADAAFDCSFILFSFWRSYYVLIGAGVVLVGWLGSRLYARRGKGCIKYLVLVLGFTFLFYGLLGVMFGETYVEGAFNEADMPRMFSEIQCVFTGESPGSEAP